MVNPHPAATAHRSESLDYLERIYLTQREVAAHLRISERTLERHRLAGTGPAFVKLGRRVVYRQGDVERWAEFCTQFSTSEREA